MDCALYIDESMSSEQICHTMRIFLYVYMYVMYIHKMVNVATNCKSISDKSTFDTRNTLLVYRARTEILL